MNGLSVSELCCLFCCPPCPSRIAAKLAFLPPEPTYSLLPDLDGSAAPGTAGSAGLRSRGGVPGAAVGGSGSTGPAEGKWKLHLTERAEFQYSQRELDATEVFFSRSSRGNRVGCMYIRCAPTARLVAQNSVCARACTLAHLGLFVWPCVPLPLMNLPLYLSSFCNAIIFPLPCVLFPYFLYWHPHCVWLSQICPLPAFGIHLFRPSLLTYKYHSTYSYPNLC